MLIKTIEDTLGMQLPHADILNGYAHFEAVSSHQYNFYCNRCGIYPPILIMDVNKKCAFHVAGCKNLHL